MTDQTGVAIVTGAGRGIGRAIASRLANRGMKVLAVARTAGDLAKTAAAATGGVCLPHPADVTRSDQVAAMVQRATEEFGRLDVLVNNAAVAPLATVEQITDTMLADTLAVNVSAVVYACRAAWPALKRSRGTIINISSVAADDPFPGFALYGATKAWVNVFTRALAAEGRADGIRVFAVGPGAVETEMLRKAFPDFPADQTLQTDDIATAVEWMLDERTRYMTGQTIYVKK
ncbi:MAG TPA: SDR family oxidoreductase [Phycisphaerae bacterium]|nr:SDR family oxidoreductase [Phycisphaerae bacterium]